MSRILRQLLFLCAAGASLGQVYTPGPQVLTFLSDVDDSDQPYALYLPKAYSSARKYPLVVSLHGAGSNHRLNLRRVFGKGNLATETDAEAGRYFPALRDVDFIVACPFARGTMGYQGIPEKDVYDMMADVKRRFAIDEDRVYLTGLSMGGGGTLWLGLTRPDLWAAIAPVCAAAPRGTEELAGNALNIPVHLFHGDQDPAVPVDVSRRWQKRLLDLGAKAEYVEYPGVRHNSWDLAYRNGAIFDWFAKRRRERYPQRVSFSTRAYKYGAAYWVRLDSLTPGTLASIDARFTGPNRIEVSTAALEAFTLKVAGHPSFSPAAAVAVKIDGEALRVKPAAEVSFHRTAGKWQPGLLIPGAGTKRPGAEGPLAEALASRQLYIYGTADSPAAEELKRRRDMAVQAAEWSSPRARLLLSFAVKPDKDVTAKEIEGSNLVLFGGRETNSVVARLADRFPLSLNPGAADYGLVFLAPLDAGHYAVVNTGLAWWTGLPGAAPPYRALLALGDFLLFKGSRENVVAEGLFDRDWKVPPEAAGKMKQTCAVR